MMRFGTCLLIAIFGGTWTAPLAAAEKPIVAGIDSLDEHCSRDKAGEIIAVDLRSAWVTDADLEKLSRLPHLESINLANTKVTDLGLEKLRPLENVKLLNLHYAENVTDLGVAHLKHWKNLEVLEVRGTKVTSSLFENISKMTKLRSLDVGQSRVNDDFFEVLLGLDHLEYFSFGGNKMSGATLPLLKSFPALRVLDVSGQQRTDSGLWSVAVTDFNIDSIAQIERLEVLDLGDTGVSDRGIAKLSQLKELANARSARDKSYQQRNRRSGRSSPTAAS